VPMQSVFKGIIPFLLIEAGFVVLLIAFPKIVLFLPSISG
jgi:TRAP-type mannitol/chloroaromatic compound transport system permease large subunit